MARCLLILIVCDRDADKNLIIFRGYTPEQLQNYDVEDCVHLLVWGQLPTPSQRSSLCSALSGAMSPILWLQ